ncbi:hypothetical protein B0H10DRAFT_1992742, partial [Mycena sp. CBHHK59/15]
MSASILVAGVHTSLVALSSHPVTAISAALINRIASNRCNDLFALTINGGPQGSFTTVLECCLGSDWTSSVQEWLISLGLPHGSEVLRGLVSTVKPSDSAISSSALESGTEPLPIYNSLSSSSVLKHARSSQPMNLSVVPPGSATVVPPGSATVVPSGLATSAHTWTPKINALRSSNALASSSSPLSVVSGPSQCTSSLDSVFLSLDRLQNILN